MKENKILKKNFFGGVGGHPTLNKIENRKKNLKKFFFRGVWKVIPPPKIKKIKIWKKIVMEVWEVTPTPKIWKWKKKKFLGGCGRSPHPQKFLNEKKKNLNKNFFWGVGSHHTLNKIENEKKKKIWKNFFLGGCGRWPPLENFKMWKTKIIKKFFFTGVWKVTPPWKIENGKKLKHF